MSYDPMFIPPGGVNDRGEPIFDPYGPAGQFVDPATGATLSEITQMRGLPPNAPYGYRVEDGILRPMEPGRDFPAFRPQQPMEQRRWPPKFDWSDTGSLRWYLEGGAAKTELRESGVGYTRMYTIRTVIKKRWFRRWKEQIISSRYGWILGEFKWRDSGLHRTALLAEPYFQDGMRALFCRVVPDGEGGYEIKEYSLKDEPLDIVLIVRAIKDLAGPRRDPPSDLPAAYYFNGQTVPRGKEIPGPETTICPHCLHPQTNKSFCSNCAGDLTTP